MRRTVLAIAAAALVLGAGALWLGVRGPKTEKAQAGPAKKTQTYDGYWLQAAKDIKNVDAEETRERLAVLEGVCKCRVQVTHAKFQAGASYSLSRRLSAYYAAHPSERRLNVLEVWQRLPEKPARQSSDLDAGEVHTEAESDELWWMPASEQEKLSYVEGYLWCMRTMGVSSPSFSREPGFYVQKIDQYYQEFATTKSRNDPDPIQTILSRYQDEKPLTK
jgi:hypothetical protein